MEIQIKNREKEGTYIINVVPKFNRKMLENIGPALVDDVRLGKFNNYFDVRYFYNAMNSFLIQKLNSNTFFRHRVESIVNIYKEFFGVMVCASDATGKILYDITSWYKNGDCEEINNSFQNELIKYKIRLPSLNTIKLTIDAPKAILLTNKATLKYHIWNKYNQSQNVLVSSSVTLVNEWNEEVLNLVKTFKQFTAKKGIHIILLILSL